MAFVLTEEQQMLRDSALAFAAEKLPVAQLRNLRSKGEAFDKAAWKEMAELGFAGVLVPEEFGGSGFGYVGLGQVLEAQGRTIASSPLLSTAMIGASALLLAGSDETEVRIPAEDRFGRSASLRWRSMKARTTTRLTSRWPQRSPGADTPSRARSDTSWMARKPIC